MGMGIAALGTAVGAATKGYMEGSRFRSEMEDADARRGLVKLQTEEAGLKLDEAKRQKAYLDERAKMYEDEAAGGAAAPAATVAANPSADGSPAGIAVPGAAPAPQAGATAPTDVRPGTVAPSNDLARMEKIIARQQQLDLKYGKIDPIQALEGMKKFKMYQQEGVIDGLRYFEQTGDTNGAIERINATGQQKMPAGTTFQVKEEEVIPGSGVKVKNVYAVSPDGKASVNYRDLLRSSLSPEKALSLDTETGVKLAELAWRKESDLKLREIQEKQLDATVAHYKVLESNQKEQTRISLERLGLDRDKYRFDKIEAGLSKAYSQALDTVGYVKVSPEKMDQLSDTQRQEMSRKLMQANVISSIFEKNFDLKNGKPGITVQEAAEAARFAATNRDKIQTDNYGATYVEIGKDKIYVPAPPKPAAAQAPAQPQPGQPAPAAAPAPAAPAPRPGLQTPQERNAAFEAQARQNLEARRAAGIATEEANRSAAAQYTPDKIAQMTIQEASQVLSRYNNYLTLEQRRALNDKM